jgi:hypothetical protein
LQEEVKVAVDTSSQTLLPAHFEAMTSCWNEALVKAPVSERVRLVNFLIQLHTLFSGWRGMYHDENTSFLTISSPVLSWDVIVGILSEDHTPGDGDTKNESADVRVLNFFWQNNV